MSGRFEPIGDRALWRIAFDSAKQARVGSVLTYAALADEMGLDVGMQRGVMQAAVRQAIPRIERELRRTLDAVRNVGYRIVPADEHLALAKRHERKARRSIVRSASKVTHVDLNEVSPTGRALFVAMRDHLTRVDATLREHGAGLRKHEERLARLEERLGMRGEPETVDGEVVDP
jgi:hypothetical protein